LFCLSTSFLVSQGILPLSEIQPGMRGQGKTVFLGSKIERFDFEILGIQKNTSPGRSTILVKLLGSDMKERGVFAGMSGSPCYVNGKLIGALSSGFAFAKEPIAGITPIQYMLDQLLEIPDQAPQNTPLILPKIDPPKVLKSALNGSMIPLSEVWSEGSRDSFNLLLTGTPLSAEAKSYWQGSGIRFLDASAPQMAKGDDDSSPIEPGGTVVASLVEGDLDISSAGTITYIQGKRLLMFGHPLYNLGSLQVPMRSGSVLGVVSNLNSSFKLTAPGKNIGSVRLDRNAGVGGLLGAESKMIPLRLGINLGGKKNLTLSFNMIDHPVLTPYFAATILSQSLESNIRGLGMQSLSLQGNIKLTGYPPIQIESFVADLNSKRLSDYLGGILQSICFNPFEKPQFEGISLTVKAEERLDLSAVVGARILTSRAKRGSPLPITLVVQNIQGLRESYNFSIPIPSSAQKGKTYLLVGDGLSIMSADPDQSSVQIGSLGDVVQVLNSSLKNNQAYGLLVQSSKGAGLRGDRIEGIPPSIASLVGPEDGSKDTSLKRRIIGRALIPLEREVQGLVTLEIEVE
ncbi:MAG: SpoIVB peptidase S55 domain-containing protein, partial [Holophagaceae bacterium]